MVVFEFLFKIFGCFFGFVKGKGFLENGVGCLKVLFLIGMFVLGVFGDLFVFLVLEFFELCVVLDIEF